MSRARTYRCPCGRIFSVKADFVGVITCRACGREYRVGLGGAPRPYNQSREMARNKRRREHKG